MPNSVVKSHWPRPGQECTCEDVPRRVLVSVQDKPAVRAGVDALRQRLPHNDPAPGTILACARRIHGHHLCSGAFSLVAKDVHETAPGGVRNRASKRVVLDHPTDVQALHPDQPMRSDQIQRSFVMMLSPKVGNASMKNMNDFDGLTAIRSALLFPTDSSLGTTQCGQFRLEIARVLDAGSVGGGEKRLKSNVDAGSWLAAGWHSQVAEVTGQDYIPFVGLTLQCGRLDCALHLSVDIDADFADVLDAELAFDESDTIAIGREFDAVEAIACLEPWIAGLRVPALAATEKSAVGLVKAAHRGLSRREVDSGEEGIVPAQVFELGRLGGVLDAAPMRFILPAPLLQAKVVKPPMRFEHNAKLSRLVDVGVEAKLVGAAHLLALLLFDVASDTRLGDGPTRPGVVAATPKGWEPRAQRRELGAQVVRSAALEASGQFGNAQGGISLDEKMHVIGHDFQGVDRNPKLGGNFTQQLNKAAVNIAHEYGSTVLGTPHEVVLEREDRTGILSVLTHVQYYTHADDLVNNRKRRAAIPLSAKADSPLAAYPLWVAG